jgi:hypothetical protein
MQHPTYWHWSASLSDRDGSRGIFVGLPHISDGDFFRIVDLPENQWTQLIDRNGRPIPLEVYIDYRGIWGRWLP